LHDQSRIEQGRRQDNSEASPCGTCPDDEDDILPFEAFQRAFERLFFLLGDRRSFDAKQFDENRDGFVSWGEFFHVYKSRDISINLSMCERIFLTFDNPDFSHLDKIVSILVLLTIIVSSFCFIMGTHRYFQDHPDDGGKPIAKPVLKTIETACLIIFTLEYLARLCTVWDVRSWIFDEQKLLNHVTGYHPIVLPSRLRRLFTFIIQPANLIDLAAILPAVIDELMDGGEGGGLVVLRLIRLTRVFRAFKSPALAEPVIVISRTIQLSTKALYVLAFNLLLGIVIFGSLMFLAEGQGTWDVETQTFVRKVGQTWNQHTQEWDDDMAPTPFRSIPETFWWAMVTATTVGYGDQFPTTSTGYMVAVLTMVFSLVILALPVGVIGGTFSQVWDELKIQRKLEEDALRQEMKFITKAIQKLDPTRMSTMMLIEVWNDQLGSEGITARPSASKFMGEAKFKLDLLLEGDHITKQITIPLEKNVDIVDREAKGYVTVKYEWQRQGTHPSKISPQGTDATGEAKVLSVASSADFELHGTLKVTVLSADGLINFDLRNGTSSPYCMVVCYPNSPVDGQLRPAVWRTPTQTKLSPRWNVSYDFQYSWIKQNHIARATMRTSKLVSSSTLGNINVASQNVGSIASTSVGSTNNASQSKLDDIMNLLQSLGTELIQVREEVSHINERVDRLSGSAESSHGAQTNQLGSNNSPDRGEPSQEGTVPEVETEPVLLPNCVPD